MAAGGPPGRDRMNRYMPRRLAENNAEQREPTQDEIL